MRYACTWLLAALCAIAPTLSAEDPLPRIGLLRWTVSSSEPLSGTVAYARGAERLFTACYNGTILVVDAQRGTIEDTIDMRTYPEVWSGVVDTTRVLVSGLACTDDGSLVVFTLSNTARILMLEYPSQRLLDSTAMGIGALEGGLGGVQSVSPRGRYVATLGLVRERHSGRRWTLPVGHHVSFDSAESKIAYNDDGTIDGRAVANMVAVRSIVDTADQPKIFDLRGVPVLSADGRLVMAAGRAFLADGSQQILRARASVLDLATEHEVWRIDGDEETVGQLDFRIAAWSADGSTFLGERRSDLLPSGEYGHLFRWRVGSAAPDAIVNASIVAQESTRFSANLDRAFVIVDASTISCFDLGRPAVSGVQEEALPTAIPALYLSAHQREFDLRCNSGAMEWSLLSIHGQRVAGGTTVRVHTDAKGAMVHRLHLPDALARGVYVVVLPGRTDGGCRTLVVVD